MSQIKKCLTKYQKFTDSLLHPDEVSISDFSKNVNGKKNVCAINFNYEKENQWTLEFDDEPQSKATDLEVIQNMNISTIKLDKSLILSIYNISGIDSLREYVSDNINFVKFEEINRLINIWILNNLLDLKKYNYALYPILKEIILKFFNFPDKYLNKDLEKFIDYWINKKNKNDFDFNLIIDFKKYLSKKYGEKK